MSFGMEKWKGAVAIVTGASAGCGASIAANLVKYGVIVAGLARRSEKVEELAKTLLKEPGKLYAINCDMTNEDDIKKAFKWVQENLGPVSILINNAGISQPTSLTSGDTAMWKKILDTNVLGLSIATREAVQQMRAHKIDGHIVHINSVLGHYVANVPMSNMYPASKFAVTALTEILRQEFIQMGDRIRVTSVSPGPVDTEFASANDLFKNESFKKLYSSMPKLSGQDVSDAVVYVLSTPPNVQVQEVMLRPLGEPV